MSDKSFDIISLLLAINAAVFVVRAGVEWWKEAERRRRRGE